MDIFENFRAFVIRDYNAFVLLFIYIKHTSFVVWFEEFRSFIIIEYRDRGF